MGILPEFHRQGIGRMLVNKLITELKEVGGKIDNKANKFANNRNNNNRSLNPNLRKNRNKEKIDEKIYYETEEDLNDSDLDSDDYEDHLLNDSDKYDPENKAKKAKPGKIAIYLE